MGIFDAPQNEFLVFEEGPSIDLELQWAKYRDASDQASLSRLWGGIHPPSGQYVTSGLPRILQGMILTAAWLPGDHQIFRY